MMNSLMTGSRHCGEKLKMIHKYRCMIMAVLILLAGAAQAEKLVLPGRLAGIGDGAFAGDLSIEEVVISDGTLAIGDSAFAACNNLGRITIPRSVESLGESFIQGCADDLLIMTEPGSAACLYAQSNSVDYQAETAYRALLIGQTYPDIPSLKLNGPDNDAAALKRCLEQFSTTGYRTTVCMNLTAEEILAAITDAFGTAAAEDVSLFYYSGHGVSSEDSSQQGALLGADNGGSITAAQLRSALDRIPGRKIVIIDACYSGNMLTVNEGVTAYSAEIGYAEEAAEAFADSFISAFSQGKGRSLVGDGYFVLTSAAADEESFESRVGDRIMGLFTSNLIAGCGYDVINDCPLDPAADSNANGVLTLREIYQYTRKSLIVEGQHARVYPVDCCWFGMLRK